MESYSIMRIRSNEANLKSREHGEEDILKDFCAKHPFNPLYPELTTLSGGENGSRLERQKRERERDTDSPYSFFAKVFTD